MATWTKLADNWESLTDDEKVALFQNVTADMPSITDLQAMGKVKIVSLTGNKSIVRVTGVPKRTVVLPKDVFSVDSFATINSMTLNCNLSGAGQVGVAVTKDLETYYIFNNRWKAIDVNNDAFMTPTQLSALTSAEWKTLLGDDTTLGIAYSLELSDITDKADIDSLTLNVDMKGTWTKAIYGDEYTYEYFNKSLRVDILKDGSYKVNYPLIGKLSTDNKPNPDDKDVPMYGVKFDGTNSLGVRTYDATTLNFTPSTATVAGIDDFKDLAPFNVKECCRVYSSSGTKYYYKENYSASEWQKIREGKHSTITGDIMIEIPSFYYSRPSENEFIVAPKVKEGFLPSPAHFRNGELLDKIWVSKYNINTNYESKSKTSPKTNINMNTFRSNLRNKEMYMLDYPTWCSLVILALVKYANMDVQASVANGYSSRGSVYANGNADNVLGLDGSNTSVSSNEASLCMGIENLYGNIWKFVDGAYSNNLDFYLGDILNITADPTNVAGLATYTKLVTKVASGTNSAIKTISYDTSAPYCIYPTSVGSPCPSGDNIYSNTSFTCCLVGGSSWVGSATGLFAFKVNYGVGISMLDLGAVGCCFS